MTWWIDLGFAEHHRHKARKHTVRAGQWRDDGHLDVAIEEVAAARAQWSLCAVHLVVALARMGHEG